ncbi:hypothetical protein [Flexivirga lutea]
MPDVVPGEVVEDNVGGVLEALGGRVLVDGVLEEVDEVPDGGRGGAGGG